jgi:hypothetical protein
VQCREVKNFELESVKRKVDSWCEMAASLGVSKRNESVVWDIRQPVRTLAEDSVKVHYQGTTSEDIADFMCAAVTVILDCVDQ